MPGASNNLRQLGLALANYESSLRCYPFGVGGTGPPGNAALCAGRPIRRLLLFIEQVPLYNSINFTGVPWLNVPSFGSDPMNLTALNTRVACFLCPSDIDRINDPSTRPTTTTGTTPAPSPAISRTTARMGRVQHRAILVPECRPGCRRDRWSEQHGRHSRAMPRQPCGAPMRWPITTTRTSP